MAQDGPRSFWCQYQKRQEKEKRFKGVQSVRLPISPAVPRTIDFSPLDIVVFSIIDWDFRFQRPQQIAARFAGDVGRTFYTCTSFSDYDKPLLSEIRDHLFEVWLPSHEPINIYQDVLTDSAIDCIVSSFSLLRREFEIVEAVIFVDLPFWSRAAFRLRDRFGWKVVYDCMDFYKGFLNTSEQMLLEEDELSEKSDLVLASSNLLFKDRSIHNPNCFLVPNGTEFRHFNKRTTEKSPELRDLKCPVIGYYGAISDWFDTELVGSLARLKPEWNFVLIGNNKEADLNPIRHLKNVYLLGEKPYSILPSYLHAFDVCIIPFKKSELTDATNPVKLFEYLSAGKPVVATNLKELEYYSDFISLASGIDEWLQAIETALCAQSAEEIFRRESFAQKNDWDERFIQIREKIASLYPKVSIFIIVDQKDSDSVSRCVERVYKKTGYPASEVIVISNSSGDIQSFIEKARSKHSEFKYISNKELLTSLRQGFDSCTGKYIALLTSDAIVSHGWIGRMLRHLGRDPGIGAVVPAFCNESYNGSRSGSLRPDIDQIDSNALQMARKYEGKSVDVNMQPISCIFMDRDTFDRSKAQIELVPQGKHLALWIKDAGYRVVCAKDVYIPLHGP